MHPTTKFRLGQPRSSTHNQLTLSRPTNRINSPPNWPPLYLPVPAQTAVGSPPHAPIPPSPSPPPPLAPLVVPLPTSRPPRALAAAPPPPPPPHPALPQTQPNTAAAAAPPVGQAPAASPCGDRGVGGRPRVGAGPARGRRCRRPPRGVGPCGRAGARGR
jgi:hypothetical protein